MVHFNSRQNQQFENEYLGSLKNHLAHTHNELENKRNCNKKKVLPKYKNHDFKIASEKNNENKVVPHDAGCEDDH